MLKFTVMYRVITISLFLLLTNFSSGQTANFFADGSRWVYHNYETWELGQQSLHSSDEQDILHGDTVIGGLTYFKLYSTFHNTLVVYMPNPMPPQTYSSYDSVGPVFLRYDTTLRKVFYLPHVDSTERLIYNFNLQVGDTVPMQSTSFSPTAVIYLIDTTIIFGVPLKRFFLNPIHQYGTMDNTNFIIEGIGGTNGLTSYQPEFGFLSGGIYMTRLNCFQYGDSIFSLDNSACPFIDFVSSVSQLQDKHTLTVSPNPTQDLFTLTISEELLYSTFTITDCLGRVVQSFKLTDINSKAHLYTSGIYFWRVEQDGRLIRTGKLICD